MDGGLNIKPADQTSITDDVQVDVGQQNIESLTAVEGLIRNRLTQIETLKSDMKMLKEMFDDFLLNDEKYSQAAEDAKEAVKSKTTAKKEAVSKPEAESIVSKLRDAREQMKDLKETLSASLRDYEKLSGSDEIEIEDGDVRKILYNARLVKASAKFGR